jgi:hypothetical protein
MASTSETGHAKNVANFEDLISFCTSYGSSYNPSKAGIKLTALNTKRTSANTQLNNIKKAKIAFDNATNERMIAFKDLRKRATRIINALDATDATAQIIADAKTINKKIQGQRAKSTDKPTKTESETPKKTASSSQQSYDYLIDHFTKLIELLSTEPLYKPNENDLKLTALNTYLTTLKTTNTNVVNTYTAYSNAQIARDKTIYEPLTGLVDIALEVKKYIKSVFGAQSPQYKQVGKIAFKKRKK